MHGFAEVRKDGLEDTDVRMVSPLVLVSGADQRYYRCLWQFVRSLKRHGLDRRHRIILYDLGLAAKQRSRLERETQKASGFEWRCFPFDRYPGHLRPEAGTYAWKPVLIADLFEELKQDVFWMDSATLLLGSLDAVADAVHNQGQYIPVSGSGSLGDRLHPDTVAYLRITDDERRVRNRAGGICGFRYGHEGVQRLVREWRALALIEACIAPPGAKCGNHHYDQALLTLLLNRYEQKEGLRLTDDEIDISSTQPVSFLSVRNKVSNTVPLPLDGVFRLGFWIRRSVDIACLRIKRFVTQPGNGVR